MIKIPNNIVKFLEKQGFVIVSSIDENGSIHCSAKGVVCVEPNGKIFVIDLYKNKTFKNLSKNHITSITAVDEKEFLGFTLQGTAKIVNNKDIKDTIVLKWENKIFNRISKRIKDSVQMQSKSIKHFEAYLPKKPSYLIEIDVKNIVNLSPPSSNKK